MNNNINTNGLAWIFFPGLVSKERCEEILNLEDSQEWKTGTIYGGLDTIHRDCNTKHTNNKDLIEEIFSILDAANSHCKWNFSIQGVEDIQLTKYTKNQHYDWHNDGNGINTDCNGLSRKLSMSILLNDDYEGGDFEIWGDKVVNSKETGTAIVFPSYFNHRVQPITKGIRYSLVAWFSGPPLV